MLGRALALVLLLTTVATPAPEAPGAYDTKEAEVRAEAVRAEVAAELAALPAHPWAGRYYWGDGLGANVTVDLAPRSGFVFEWHGCMGLYGRNYGPLTETGTRVVLEPELPNEDGAFAGIDEELVPVSWGTRAYLVAAGKIDAFCNAVNDGSEPRQGVHGHFLLREGDEKKPTSGRPSTPEGELSCLLDRPIQGRVASVSGQTTKVEDDVSWTATTVVLDVGSAQGVWVGMRFHVVQPGNVYESARVTHVSEGSSEALFESYGQEAFAPRANWLLSTRRN